MLPKTSSTAFWHPSALANNMNAFSATVRQLSKDEINELPMLAYEGDILLVETEGELTRALSRLKGEQLLGFDTESRPSFKKGKSYPTSLIQLASADVVVLVRLNRVPFSETLTQLLADPQIIKAGVAIRDDIRALLRLHPFVPAGLSDLADMAKKRNIGAQGLRTLAAHLLGGRISKAAQCSNWEKKNLTPQQIRYAATDAWIGRQIYLKMTEND